MKKILATLIAAAMMLSVGCSTEAEQSSSTTPPATSNSTSTPASEAEPASEPVEISFWHSMDGVFGEIVNEQIDTFNSTIGAEKNITVTGVFQNWPGTDGLVAAMTTDDVENMPDVIQMYGEHVSIVRDYDRTVWAEDFINSADSSLSKDDLIPNSVSSYSIEDKMIGLPYTVSSLMLYYNNDYLAAAGYDAPPATIAEMAEMMPAIVENTDAEYGLNVRVNLYEMENFLATQGVDGSYFGNNESGHAGHMTELTADDNGTLMNFLNEWEKVVNTGVFKETRDSINEEFAAGMHGMVIMTSSRIQTIDDLVGDSFDWSVAPIPTVSADDVGGAYPSGSGLFMIDRDDDAKVAAAWEFTSYMASAEAQAMWLDGTGYTPVNVNTMELDAYKNAVAAQPKLEIATSNLLDTPTTVVASYTPNSSTVDGVIKDAMMAFGSGDMSKDDAYAAIVSGVDAAIEEYYRANPIAE